MRIKYNFGSRHTGHLENIEKQKEKFPKLVKDIVNMSDMILEVLDARFIQESRNEEIEAMILSQGKKVIFVLNKADLIDKSKIRKQVEDIEEKSKIEFYPIVLVSCKTRKGSRELRDRIKMEARKIEVEKAKKREGKKIDAKFDKVNVGVIGYPNTGKSSLINFLTGTASARVGAESGFTKGIQKVKLTTGIHVLDTPGVIPENEYSHTSASAVQKQSKLGARTLDKIRDPELVVIGLMNTNWKEIEKFYGVDAKGDMDEFIEQLGRKMSFLKKGGLVNEDRTARLVIRDWQEGKIRL